jgi:hypothetical protein
MQEDDRVTLSLGSRPACFLWAHEQSNLAAHWEFVRANCSGVLGIDAGHESGRTILCAPDPLRNFPVFFTLGEQNDHDHMDAFSLPDTFASHFVINT